MKDQFVKCYMDSKTKQKIEMTARKKGISVSTYLLELLKENTTPRQRIMQTIRLNEMNRDIQNLKAALLEFKQKQN